MSIPTTSSRTRCNAPRGRGKPAHLRGKRHSHNRGDPDVHPASAFDVPGLDHDGAAEPEGPAQRVRSPPLARLRRPSVAELQIGCPPRCGCVCRWYGPGLGMLTSGWDFDHRDPRRCSPKEFTRRRIAAIQDLRVDARFRGFRLSCMFPSLPRILNHTHYLLRGHSMLGRTDGLTGRITGGPRHFRALQARSSRVLMGAPRGDPVRADREPARAPACVLPSAHANPRTLTLMRSAVPLRDEPHEPR
jgi:hypothetical protein